MNHIKHNERIRVWFFPESDKFYERKRMKFITRVGEGESYLNTFVGYKNKTFHNGNTMRRLSIYLFPILFIKLILD